MPLHPFIEQLIEAQLNFLEQKCLNAPVLSEEFEGFYQWLCKQRLAEIWSFEQIQQLLQQQLLNTALSESLLAQIAEQLRFALIHPCNDETQISQLLSVFTIDKTAQYISKKSAHREKLIHHVVNHPDFSALISQLIQHAIQDYLAHSMVKHVPGVSSFMKIGKSMIETVTDHSLDETIQQYLQRNILKFSQISESVLNQHFDDDTLYHFQASLWHQVKQQPLSVLRHYIEVQDLPQTVGLAAEFWDSMRQSDYLKKQLHDGVYAWYARNQEQRFDALLRDLNIDQALVEHALNALLQPLMAQLVHSGYLRQRSRALLSEFYYSDAVLALFPNTTSS